jgi:RNA polymerase sigma-70 factor, ECF subfamily
VAGCAADDDPAETALETVDTDGALAMLARLPAAQSEVILLRVVAGLDAERVATIVGKSTGSVRVLQHRGLRRLAQLLVSDRPDTRGVAR